MSASDVTDADRAKASEVLFGISSDPGVLRPHEARHIERVAAALAEEREKARAPFLALAKAWEDDSREWYYENRHTHEQGIHYVIGYEDGWEHADKLLRRALDAS